MHKTSPRTPLIGRLSARTSAEHGGEVQLCHGFQSNGFLSGLRFHITPHQKCARDDEVFCCRFLTAERSTRAWLFISVSPCGSKCNPDATICATMEHVSGLHQKTSGQKKEQKKTHLNPRRSKEPKKETATSPPTRTGSAQVHRSLHDI